MEHDIVAGLKDEEKELARIILYGGELPDGVKFRPGLIKELRLLRVEFPEEIRRILDKRGERSKQESAAFYDYFESRLGWRERLPEFKEQIVDEKDIGGQLIDEDKEEKIDDVEKSSVGFVSQRDLKDLQMTSRAHGWEKYWANRLQTELDLLPAGVAEAVRQVLLKKSIHGRLKGELARYIERRINVLSFDVQKRKRMRVLKRQLSLVESGAGWGSVEARNRIRLFYDEKDKIYYVTDGGGNKKELGLGDILADYAWGLGYDVDASVPEKIRRLVRRRIAVNEARRDIENIFDKELGAVYGIPSGVGSMGEKELEEVYFIKDKSGHIEGLLAEKIAREFLTRLSINNSRLDFVVERANAVEDTQLKYDFKIRRRLGLRGVALEDINLSRDKWVEEKRRVGLQWTLGHGKGKKKQIEEAIRTAESLTNPFIKRKVDDIVLVKIPFKGFIDCFDKWIQSGKQAGGPEQHLTHDIKEAIIIGATKGFSALSEDELREIAL